MVQKVRRKTPVIEVMEFTGDNLKKFAEWVQSQGAQCFCSMDADLNGCVIFWCNTLLHIGKGGKVFKAEGRWYCIDEEWLKHEFEFVDRIDSLLPTDVLDSFEETKKEIDGLISKLEQLESKIKRILA